MSRFAVLSDIHGNLPALLAVVADLAQRQVDQVLNLGDHVSGPLWPRETADFLMAQPWLQIKGNHERQLTSTDPAQMGLSDHYAWETMNPDHLAWLKNLPVTAQLGTDLFLFHGSPTSDLTYLTETVTQGRVHLATLAEISTRLAGSQAPVMLCGHSHLPRLLRTRENNLIVNPGSVGLQAYADNAPEHVVENGSPEARYAILEQKDTGWQVEFIAVPYPHLEAAVQARLNQREDWEIALRTGFMLP